jgi:alpha-tubulin suppressor-like RCC1 family protein
VSVLGARSFKQIATDVNSGIVALEGSTGLAWAWGKNSIGQLGVNNIVNYSSPVSVFGGKSWSQLTAMGGRYFAVDGSTGALYGWGGGYNVGDGNSTANNSSPVSVASGKSWRLVQASFTNQIAFIQDTMGTAYYWGAAITDQLGLGAGNQSSPVALGRYLPRF